MEDMDVRSTRTQIEEFRDSILWADIVREITEWKEGFIHEVMSIVDTAADDNPSTASVLLHMGDISGRAKAIDYMLSILDIFLDTLEIKKEEEDERSR